MSNVTLPSNTLLWRAEQLLKQKREGGDPFIGIGFMQEVVNALRPAHEPLIGPAAEQSAANSGQCVSREAAQSGTTAGSSLIADAIQEIDAFCDRTNTAWPTLRALRDRLSAASPPPPSPDDVRDAERYRWLRTGNDYERIGPMVVLCEADHSKNDHRPFWSLAELALDAAVDKARATATKAPEQEPCPCDSPYRKDYECMHPHLQPQYKCRRLGDGRDL